jgi:hypothetical protein
MMPTPQYQIPPIKHNTLILLCKPIDKPVICHPRINRQNPLIRTGKYQILTQIIPQSHTIQIQYHEMTATLIPIPTPIPFSHSLNTLNIYANIKPIFETTKQNHINKDKITKYIYQSQPK